MIQPTPCFQRSVWVVEHPAPEHVEIMPPSCWYRPTGGATAVVIASACTLDPHSGMLVIARRLRVELIRRETDEVVASAEEVDCLSVACRWECPAGMPGVFAVRARLLAADPACPDPALELAVTTTLPLGIFSPRDPRAPVVFGQRMPGGRFSGGRCWHHPSSRWLWQIWGDDGVAYWLPDSVALGLSRAGIYEEITAHGDEARRAVPAARTSRTRTRAQVDAGGDGQWLARIQHHLDAAARAEAAGDGASEQACLIAAAAELVAALEQCRHADTARHLEPAW